MNQLRVVSLPLCLVLAAASLWGCNSESAKNVTSAAIGKAVEVTKGTVTGIAQGVEQGRKAGESPDGARIVTSWKDLEAAGELTVASLAAGATGTTVTLAVENRTDQPLRVSDVEVLGVDSGGFVVRPVGGQGQSVSVPPKAKDRVVVELAGKDVKTVRVWGKDMPTPAMGK